MDAKLRKDYVDGLEPPEKKVTDLPNLAKETIVEFQEFFLWQFKQEDWDAQNERNYGKSEEYDKNQNAWVGESQEESCGESQEESCEESCEEFGEEYYGEY